MNKELIEKIENKVNSINIIDNDPFVAESCKNLYRALLVVLEYENTPITISNILNDTNKAIELLKKFDSINKEKYNGDLSYIVVDINNYQTLLYLIELLKQSIYYNNEVENKETATDFKDEKDININRINKILRSIFLTSQRVKIEKIDSINFLPSEVGYTIEVKDNHNKFYYMGVDDLGYIAIVRENSVEGKVIYAPDDDYIPPTTNNFDDGVDYTKDIYTLEQKPWIEYLEIDEKTGERKLRTDAPEEIVKKYNEFIGNVKNNDNELNSNSPIGKIKDFLHINLKNNNKIDKFAQEHGYKGAEFIGNWKEYKVYEPYMDKNQASYIGLPLVILVNNKNEIRMSTSDEAMATMRDDSFMKSFEETNNARLDSLPKRNELLNIKDEFKKERNKYNDLNISSELYLTYLNKIESILLDRNFEVDNRYLIKERLNINWISNDDAIHYLFDLIDGNVIITPEDLSSQGINLSDANSKLEQYFKDGLICSQEKDLLLSLVNKIKSFINVKKTPMNNNDGYIRKYYADGTDRTIKIDENKVNLFPNDISRQNIDNAINNIDKKLSELEVEKEKIDKQIAENFEEVSKYSILNKSLDDLLSAKKKFIENWDIMLFNTMNDHWIMNSATYRVHLSSIIDAILRRIDDDKSKQQKELLDKIANCFGNKDKHSAIKIVKQLKEIELN